METCDGGKGSDELDMLYVAVLAYLTQKILNSLYIPITSSPFGCNNFLLVHSIHIRLY